MAFDFPNTPTTGQQTSTPSGVFQWDGVKWVPVGAPLGYGPLGIVNIKDFGAKGDGVTSDVAAFNSFNTWARTQTQGVTLVMPPGTYAGINSNPGGGSDFFVGVKDLTISAYGATIGIMRGCNGFAVNATAPLPVWAPIANQVNAFSTTVTLSTPANVSLFPVGRWCAVTSLEMQGNGFPPNWYYVDYVQVSAVNSSTGVVTFTDPVMFTHKTTYPITTAAGGFDGGAYPGESGGPATLFLLVPDWDTTLKIYGLTVSAAAAGSGPTLESIITGRRMRFIDCSFIGSVAPSSCLHCTFENCVFAQGTGSYFIEVDKNTTHLKFLNCKINKMSTASASNDIVIDGCNISTMSFAGSKDMAVRNSYIGQWTLSSPQVGANRRMVIENCNVASYTMPQNTNFILLSNLTFTNGTFSMPLTSPNILQMYKFAIPGSKCFFNSTSNINLGNPFVILSVYQDSTNVYFDTTLTALPTYSGIQTTSPGICQHPCPRLTAANNTGPDTILVTGKGTTGIKELPLYSYASKLYCEDLIQPGTSSVAQQIMQWGTFVSLKVNVVRADTGPNGTLTMNPIGKNGALTVSPTNVTGAVQFTVNLKTAGLRTITPTTVTGNVAGDTLVAPGLVWFLQIGIWPYLSANIASDTPAQMPIVEVELITDQGVTAYEYTVQ